jgi:ATPsynthase alpha/beta subunit N-term extension
VTAGDIYATVPENTLMDHKVLVPPGARGNISWIAPAGEYTIADEVIEIEFAGQKKVTSSHCLHVHVAAELCPSTTGRLCPCSGVQTTPTEAQYSVHLPLTRRLHAVLQRYTMKQTWPVRSPRPVAEKMLANTPLLTGQRVLDALFPSVLGGAHAAGRRLLSWCAVMPVLASTQVLVQVLFEPSCRHMRHPGRLWLRQDRHLPGAVEVLQLGRHHLRGLRRARQRDGRGGAVLDLVLIGLIGRLIEHSSTA